MFNITSIMRYARQLRFALSLITINDHKCRARFSIFDCPTWTLPVAIASWKVFPWRLPANRRPRELEACVSNFRLPAYG
jgi:hypothetical protein